MKLLLDDDSCLVKQFKSTFLIPGAYKKTAERQDTSSTTSSTGLTGAFSWVVGGDPHLVCKEKIGDAEKREVYKVSYPFSWIWIGSLTKYRC